MMVYVQAETCRQQKTLSTNTVPTGGPLVNLFTYASQRGG